MSKGGTRCPQRVGRMRLCRLILYLAPSATAIVLRTSRSTYKRRPFGIKTRSSKSKNHCTSNARTAAGIAPSKIVT